LLTIGNVIPLQDENGNRFNGQVVSVTDELVKLDFNHPLADEDLYFTGKIIEVRDATQQELEHGHIHQDGHDH
jgi:FKBP-type peptidyl-prolyl cis-trans isomerase SlyD